jgi:hypothetical protein
MIEAVPQVDFAAWLLRCLAHNIIMIIARGSSGSLYMKQQVYPGAGQGTIRQIQ